LASSNRSWDSGNVRCSA